jgi:hypothetical protein
MEHKRMHSFVFTLGKFLHQLSTLSASLNLCIATFELNCHHHVRNVSKFEMELYRERKELE